MLLPTDKRLATAAVLLAALFPPAYAEPKLIETRESKYNSIFVFRHGSHISMSFGLNDRLYTESKANSNDPLELPSLYTRYMTLPLAYRDRTHRLLEIGLGGGTTTTYLRKTFPHIKVQGVEIDPVVVELAEKYFFIKPGPKLDIATRDGRVFLMRSREKYDVILIDAYRGPSIPFHLLTKEFFELAKRRLTPNGTVAYNVHAGTKLYDAALATLNSVFANVDVYKAAENYVLIGYDGPKKSQRSLMNRASEIDRIANPRYRFSALIAARQPAQGVDGQVLTDDYAPVDSLHATERETSRLN